MSGYHNLVSLDIDESEKPNPSEGFVKLRSNDMRVFIVPRYVAVISGTIRRLLSDPGEFRELTGPMPVLEFENIDGATLEHVVKFMFYKHHNQNATGAIPAFPILPSYSLPLLEASKYLEL